MTFNSTIFRRMVERNRVYDFKTTVKQQLKLLMYVRHVQSQCIDRKLRGKIRDQVQDLSGNVTVIKYS
jgi:hypothetical protein